MEVVFRDGIEEVKVETEEKKDKPTELSNAEKKKLNEKIYKRNIKDLEYFEGKISHIYLDTDGNMTAGTGTNVENRQIFQTVNFRDRDGNLLSKEEKDALYDQIQEDKKQISNFKGYSAKYYKNKWDVHIDDAERQALMKNHIEDDIEDDIEALRRMCKKRGKDFDKMPPSQQDALLDMRYNMGGNFNEKKWPNFLDGLQLGDYDVMSGESSREKPISKERNEWTQKKFEEAKKEAQMMR